MVSVPLVAAYARQILMFFVLGFYWDFGVWDLEFAAPYCNRANCSQAAKIFRTCDKSRSVWSASRLAGAFNHPTHTKAGASSAHSIRFARHDRPCHPSVQFAPYPPKICAKKQDFRLYYSARRATISKIRRRERERSGKKTETQETRMAAKNAENAERTKI